MRFLYPLFVFLLIIVGSRCFSQSNPQPIVQKKNQFLKSNRYDLLATGFEFPNENFKIVGFGAYHGSRKTEIVEQVLLQDLLSKGRIKYYLPETDFGIAYYFNEYLKSGDKSLLQDLVKHYGKRIPQEKSIETYNKWIEIKKLNDNLAEKNKLVVLGVDLMVTYKYSIKLLTKLLPLPKGKLNSYDNLVNMINIDTTDYSPNYDGYSKSVVKSFVADYHRYQSEFQVTKENQIIIDHLIYNMELTLKTSEREKTMFENYVALDKVYDFKKNPQFVRMGFFHIEKAREDNRIPFLTRLIESNMFTSKDIISIAGFLTKSRVLWNVKYNEKKEYTGFTTEGGFGIGDYWKEHFKGIQKLKENRLSDLTLFHLNKESSPYHNNQKDLMEIKLFLKKSNKADLKGKSTTDYFDYAILIRNSEANVPIEEIEKHSKSEK